MLRFSVHPMYPATLETSGECKQGNSFLVHDVLNCICISNFIIVSLTIGIYCDLNRHLLQATQKS